MLLTPTSSLQRVLRSEVLISRAWQCSGTIIVANSVNDVRAARVVGRAERERERESLTSALNMRPVTKRKKMNELCTIQLSTTYYYPHSLAICIILR